jgi:hypothetical protein
MRNRLKVKRCEVLDWIQLAQDGVQWRDLVKTVLNLKRIKCKKKKLNFTWFLYGWETWSLTLREGHRLGVFENRVMRICGPKREEVAEDGQDYIMRSFITCTLHQILLW